MQNPDDVLSRFIFTLITVTESKVTSQKDKSNIPGLQDKKSWEINEPMDVSGGCSGSDVDKLDVGHVGAHEETVQRAELLGKVADKQMGICRFAGCIQHTGFFE